MFTWQKRIKTCWLALRMPTEGVAENLETALECWDFYTERPPEPTIPVVPPSIRSAKVVSREN